MLETIVFGIAALALVLATLAVMRTNALGSSVDALADELDALDALPGEVHDVTERANRVLARLNARARRAAAAADEDELDEEDDEEPPRQGELRAVRMDPVSERILAERRAAAAQRKD